MRHWLQLATRNWRVKLVRTSAIVLAIALGVASVVWVTCCFESVRVSVLGWAQQYVGASQLTVESPLGKYDTLPQRLVESISALPEVQRVNIRLVQRLRAQPVNHLTGVAPASPPVLVPPTSPPLVVEPASLPVSDAAQSKSVGPASLPASDQAGRDAHPTESPPESQPTTGHRWNDQTPEVDLHGIEVEGEQGIRHYTITAGRMLRTDDQHVCVLESGFAREEHVGVGDKLLVWAGSRSDDQPYELEIVGLMERRRIARFQKGQALVSLNILQQMALKQGLVTSMDVVLHDPSPENIRRSADRIRAEVRKKSPNATVRDVNLRIQQIKSAQSQQEFILVLLSCVAMLTALFIILSTLSVGMIERIAQLGLMRCVGLTGGQLALLMLAEVIPLGLLGVSLGVPLGLGLTGLTVLLVPEYVGSFPIHWSEMARAAGEGLGPFFSYLGRMLRDSGIALASIAGLSTTFVATMLPTFAAVSVSPLEASRPRSRRSRQWLLLVVAALAGLTLVLQYFIVNGFPDFLRPIAGPVLGVVQKITGYEISLDGLQRTPSFLGTSTASIVLLYVGYALLAPVAVWLVGQPAVLLVARLTNVQSHLLQDQVGHAVWRSAGICQGLMVGLSLIVGLVVFSESVRAGWQFPTQFPEAYIWSFDQMTPDTDRIVREEIEREKSEEGAPRIRDYTTANALNVIVEERPLFMEAVFRSVTWFLGIEPESFFRMVKLEFVEGNEPDALRLLNQGGHVVIAEDFARTRNKHTGDSVRVFVGQQQFTFKVAGVVQSPALDVAAGFFQAHSEFNVVAVGSVMGTVKDMERVFNFNGRKIVLINFDRPNREKAGGWPGGGASGGAASGGAVSGGAAAAQDAVVPRDWPPPRGWLGASGLGDEYYDESVPLAARWQRYQEMQLLARICKNLNAPGAFHGTVRELKDQIDRELTGFMRLLTAVPAVALLIAAIGVANLMTASVTSRARQIAMLRAVGATRGLVLRMVVGEALVLGVLGSLLGLALGVHLAHNTTTLTSRMWGFAAELRMPWNYVAAAAALTIGLCILAGIMPARHASRTNIVDALRVA